MAAPTVDFTAFAQSVYLTIKNRYFDDIAGEDGQIFITQVADWVNMFIDELESTPGPDGNIVDWWFTRSNGATLGTAQAGSTTISTPSTVDHLITDEGRYVQIIDATGKILSNWSVVHPRDINNSGKHQEDLCAVVGDQIVFSRPFTAAEDGLTVTGDVITKLPRIAFTTDANGVVTATNVKLLSIVRPKQLLVLGVAKNATLPDIVQGKLSPSFATKFDNLMTGAIARSTASSQAAQAARQNFSGVRGVY